MADPDFSPALPAAFPPPAEISVPVAPPEAGIEAVAANDYDIVAVGGETH
jgi:hypothetical protein